MSAAQVSNPKAASLGVTVLVRVIQINNLTAVIIARAATAQDLYGALRQTEGYTAENLHPQTIADEFEIAKVQALELLRQIDRELTPSRGKDVSRHKTKRESRCEALPRRRRRKHPGMPKRLEDAYILTLNPLHIPPFSPPKGEEAILSEDIERRLVKLFLVTKDQTLEWLVAAVYLRLDLDNLSQLDIARDPRLGRHTLQTDPGRREVHNC
ncbi:hypothetical protein F4860DRAFT_519507 [Xylaria cubensis]|nr:hypothetical protein F4860DRAFT_519507 [Xylaria cubensis]